MPIAIGGEHSLVICLELFGSAYFPLMEASIAISDDKVKIPRKIFMDFIEPWSMDVEFNQPYHCNWLK